MFCVASLWIYLYYPGFKAFRKEKLIKKRILSCWCRYCIAINTSITIFSSYNWKLACFYQSTLPLKYLAIAISALFMPNSKQNLPFVLKISYVSILISSLNGNSEQIIPHNRNEQHIAKINQLQLLIIGEICKILVILSN